MASATCPAKEVNASSAYRNFVDVIHLGLTGKEEFDQLVERYPIRKANSLSIRPQRLHHLNSCCARRR